MKSNRLNLILYIIAALFIFIPATIVFVTGNGLNSVQVKLFICIAFILVIAGRILTVEKKTRENKSIQWVDIGIISGMFITLVEIVLK